MTASYPNPLPETLLPADRLSWLDAHAGEVHACLRREREWFQGHRDRHTPGQQPALPWAQVIHDWLFQAPGVDALVGLVEDPARLRRLATWQVWLGALQSLPGQSPDQQWMQLWHPQTPIPTWPSVKARLASAVTEGLSLGQIVTTAEGAMPLWKALTPGLDTWKLDSAEAVEVNPPRWARTFAPEAWETHIRSQLISRLREQGKAVDTDLDALEKVLRIADQRVERSGAWRHWTDGEGTPVLWSGIYAVPRFMETVYKQLRDESISVPDQFWQATNAQGKDLWFAALESPNSREHALSVKLLTRLAQVKKNPSPDDQGRGWVVASPRLLRGLTQSRLGGNTGSYPVRGRLRQLVQGHPAWAFAGTSDQHAALADQIWSHERSHAALVELAIWGSKVPVYGGLMTEPLRGLLIEATGYALQQEVSGQSNQANILWTDSDRRDLQPHLERLVDSRPWRVPELLPNARDGLWEGALPAGLRETSTWTRERAQMWEVFNRITTRLESLQARPATPVRQGRRRV